MFEFDLVFRDNFDSDPNPNPNTFGFGSGAERSRIRIRIGLKHGIQIRIRIRKKSFGSPTLSVTAMRRYWYSSRRNRDCQVFLIKLFSLNEGWYGTYTHAWADYFSIGGCKARTFDLDPAFHFDPNPDLARDTLLL